MKERKRKPQPTLSEQIATQEEQRRQRAERRFFHAFRSPDSYGLLFLMIGATYVVAVSVSRTWGATILVFVQIATVWLALRTSLASRHIRRFAHVLFALAGVLAVLNLFIHDESDFVGLVFVGAGILYFVAPFAIVRHIGFRTVIDQETMLGALCAYLLLGMAFAFSYRFIGTVQDTPFFGAHGDGSLADAMFFSFVTLTTTGYGNLVPANNPGQTFAVMEALIGQLFLVTAVAKFVNAWRPRAWGGGEVPPDEGQPEPS